MNAELIESLRMLAKERGIEEEQLFEFIEEALVAAYKREFNAKTTDNVRAEVDQETGEMRVFVTRTVVEEIADPNAEVSLEDAKAFSEDFEIGDMLEFQLSPQDFGRLAAQQSKSVINQRLAQAEREIIHREFSDRVGEIAYGVVQRKDRREVIVDIGRAEAVLTKHEQSRQDNYDFNQRMRFYILRVDERHGRPIVLVSRSHPNFVRRLFEQEVPEITSDVVEIVTVAREAGSRTKISVRSDDPNVDAVGSCVGQRGMRVQNVIDELNGEKIDIVEWDEDPIVFISNALSPAKVISVDLFEDGTARVVVPDHQLSLAIGRSGQNARLAARLTGWKIDIESESEYRENKEIELLSHFDDALANQDEALQDDDYDNDDEDDFSDQFEQDLDMAAIDKAFADLDQLDVMDEQSETEDFDENQTDETSDTHEN
ncbi:MAG: transcription termination/antitermination protein NusA [Clostridiaceae bacterium]|mgnify:CR=1 FL=1|nr:transcription termination/antitermination protein NusA [Clostridiaceae bacterium]